jgi:hypothetical protein
MDNKISNPKQTIFEQIKRVSENKSEYWTARDLAKVLEYSEYRHFKPVIDRAKEACSNSGYAVSDHFEDILDMIELGKGAKRETENVKLSRYGCYLFRATQTEEKLKRENIKGKQKANLTHFEVGKKVRETIQELGGTMPENLPVAGSIKKLEKKDEPKKLKGKKKK